MTTPTKTRRNKWNEDDDNWFANHPQRIYRLRRFSNEELVDKGRPKPVGVAPTHVLIMQGGHIRYTLRCHDGVGGGFFDLMLRARDEVCSDDVCAAIWGHTLFNGGSWSRGWDWVDLVTLVKLSMRIPMGWLSHEPLP